MRSIKKDPGKGKKVLQSIPIPGWLFTLVTVVYCEVLLHLWTMDGFSFGRFAAVLLFALASVPAAVLAMGLNPNYLKALSALVVAVFLSIPYWKGKYFHASVKAGGADVSAEAEASIGGDRNA